MIFSASSFVIRLNVPRELILFSCLSERQVKASKVSLSRFLKPYLTETPKIFSYSLVTQISFSFENVTFFKFISFLPILFSVIINTSYLPEPGRIFSDFQ